MYPVNFKINIVHSIIGTEIFFNLLLLKIFTTTYFLNFIRSTVTSYKHKIQDGNYSRKERNVVRKNVVV